MANMTNFSEKPSRRAWATEPGLDGQALASFTIPNSGSTTFYDGQAIGRDGSGTLVQMDDTAKAEFVGFQTDIISGNMPVNSTDSAGDKIGHIHRPYAFVALITSAAAGDEGKKVYWKFNNQVEYSTTNSNFAGTVLGVIDSTHVLVLAPWIRAVTEGGFKGYYSAAAAAGTTLTKWDLNKVILCPLTASEAITLPAASKCSPGDMMLFVNTSSNGSIPTLTAAGADTINGNATYAMTSGQYTSTLLVCDGSSKWNVAGLGLVSGNGLAVPLRIALMHGRNSNGTVLDATGASGNFKISLTEGTSLVLTGNAAQNNTKTDKVDFEFSLPSSYVAGQNLTVTINAKHTEASGTTLTNTVQAKAFLQADAGTMGSDLIGASALAITGSAADYTFTLPGTSLTPGCRLVVQAISVATEGGNTGTTTNSVGSVRMS